MARAFTFLILCIGSLWLVACGPGSHAVSVRQIGKQWQLLVHQDVVHTSTQRIQDPQLAYDSQIDSGERAVYWSEGESKQPQKMFALFRNGRWDASHPADYEIDLRTGRFDPLKDLSNARMESAGPDVILALIQFHTAALESYRAELSRQGVEILQSLNNQTVLARLRTSQMDAVQNLSFVRWAGAVQAWWKVAPSLTLQQRAATQSFAVSVVPARLEDRDELLAFIIQRVGRKYISNVTHTAVDASLTRDQLWRLARSPLVQWLEPSADQPQEDMDQIREMGGANFLGQIEPVIPDQYTGIGIRGHVLEGVYREHPDFAKNEFRSDPIPVDDSRPSTHGQATYGIIFGSGAGNPAAKGLLPNAQGYYTHYDVVHQGLPEGKMKGTRYELVQRLRDEYHVMFQSASWGYAVTNDYTARSLEMDNIIFDLDLPITQSMGNNGDHEARPQAWAKNIISVGAIYHFGTIDNKDDKWDGSEIEGRSSIGPAADGRIKPDLVANYDGTLTTSVQGYTVFTGTSAATPVVAGHVGLLLEMWLRGVFSAGKAWAVNDYFAHRPHASTVKALLINSARRYAFEGVDADLTRVHQGWGFPDLKNLYLQKDHMLLIDESEVLTAGQDRTWEMDIKGDKPLAITMVFSDPPSGLMQERTLMNNLNLKVTAPDGTVYWGNNGLLAANESAAGGEPNSIDNVENVLINTPQAGKWLVQVIAEAVNADGHVETPEVDVDFALVATGIESQTLGVERTR